MITIKYYKKLVTELGLLHMDLQKNMMTLSQLKYKFHPRSEYPQEPLLLVITREMSNKLEDNPLNNFFLQCNYLS